MDIAGLAQTLRPGIEGFRQMYLQSLVAAKGGIDPKGALLSGDRFVVSENIAGIVSRAQDMDAELFQDVPDRKLAALESGIGALPDLQRCAFIQQWIPK
jgi:hypothetical protein